MRPDGKAREKHSPNATCNLKMTIAIMCGLKATAVPRVIKVAGGSDIDDVEVDLKVFL